MELRVTQNHVGCYNLLRPSEKSLSFSMTLFKDGKVVQENGVDARLQYSGEPEEEGEFSDPLDNLEWIFEQCYKYSDRVVSSTNYAAQCMLFARLYNDNYHIINEKLVSKERERVDKEIVKLQKRLTVTNIIPQIYETVNSCLHDQIKKYTTWKQSSMKELDQLKEESPKYAETKKRIDGYDTKIATLQSQKFAEEDQP